MKIKVLILLFSLFVGNLIHAQGIHFTPGTWDEVLAKARAENKVLFVDIYTAWCGPCKMMEKTIFPLEKVGDYYNRHFVSYQLDGEKGEGPAIVKKYGVSGYPAFLFLDGSGKLLYRFSGSKNAGEFLEEAGKVSLCAKYGGWEKMQNDYKAGITNMDFLKDYYELAAKTEKPKVYNAYLMSMPDEQLFTAEIGRSLGNNLTLYDYQLMTRLVEGRVKMGIAETEFDFLFTFPLQLRITEFFNKSIKHGNKIRFEELLTLKKKLSVLPRTSDKDIDMIDGRGLAFASEDFLRLHYWYTNRDNDEEFKRCLPEYIENIMFENPIDSLAERLKKSEKFLLQDSDMQDFIIEKQALIASYLLDWLDYYWRMVPSDKVTREKCAQWVDYVCRLNPYNAQAPLKAVDLLVRLDQDKKAESYLELALAKQNILHSTDIQGLPPQVQNEKRLLMKKISDAIRDIRHKKL